MTEPEPLTYFGLPVVFDDRIPEHWYPGLIANFSPEREGEDQ